MIVIDASVLATALGDDSDDGARARKCISGEDMAAPELIDLEVVSVWRRTLTDQRRATLALTDLAELPLSRVPHLPLLSRCWQLRHNVTSYDAAYLALAEALEVPLLTGDRRLAGASGLRCRIEVFD